MHFVYLLNAESVYVLLFQVFTQKVSVTVYLDSIIVAVSSIWTSQTAHLALGPGSRWFLWGGHMLCRKYTHRKSKLVLSLRVMTDSTAPPITVCGHSYCPKTNHLHINMLTSQHIKTGIMLTLLKLFQAECFFSFLACLVNSCSEHTTYWAWHAVWNHINKGGFAH